MRHLCVALLTITLPASLTPHPGFSQRRAITFEDFIAVKAVSDPQLSPDGRWVAYAVATPSLTDNRNVSRIWLAEVATGANRQITQGPGSDRSPRWSPDGRTLAFLSTRQNGAQVWVLDVTGGEARRVSNLPEGAGELTWLPDGKGFLVVGDVKWPPQQEIDRRNGDYPTDARLWTELLWRHWDEFRAGRRQHVFRVDLAGGEPKDLTPVDHDVPAIATGGDGDVAVSPDGREIAIAMHGDSIVADNTNVDVYVMAPDGGGLHAVTADNKGADNTPRYSPDGQWFSWLSMERTGFEADRLRLMVRRRSGGRAVGGSHGRVDALGRLVYVVSRLQVHLCRRRRAGTRQRLSHRRAVVPSDRRALRRWRQHERERRRRRQDARLPASERHPTAGGVDARQAAVAPERRCARRSRPAAARRVRLRGCPGRFGVRLDL